MVDQSLEQPAESLKPYRTVLMDLPPSSKLVARVLILQGPSTTSELIEATLLPRRTVGFAITRLESKGVIHSRPHLRDSRKTIYELTPPREYT